MADEAGASNAGGSGGGEDGGWRGGGRRHSAPVAQRATTRQSTAEAEASAQRSARPFGRTRRQVPDAPRDQTEEPAPKRRKLKPKKGGKARRRRALRNMPSDVWAAVFGQLPAMARELPGLRLVCRQFDDTVSGRVLTHLRPARTIRDAQLSSLLQRFPILQSIDVSGCTRLTGAWLRDIEHHSTIKHLVLDDCPRMFPPRESSYWIYIASAERLEHMSMANNPYFGLEDLQLAYELENLRSLSISGCTAITPDALLLFGQDPQFARTMTSLDLSRLPKLDDPSMAGLPGLSSLQELNLQHCGQLTREGLGFAAPLPALTALNVEGCARLSTVGAALGVSALASLRRLDMSWVGAELEHEGPHEDGDQAALRAANNGFGFAGWAEALAGCLTNLEDLRAGGTNATDFDLLALRPLTKLTALDLSDSPEISNDGMAALTAFQRLSCLTLEGCIGVSDAGIAHIVTLQHLTDLDFGACDDITDTALESLASVTSLAVLNVMDCSVSDEAVVVLRKALPRLAVSHTRAPEGYWELILTDTEDEFDDLNGEEWEMMLVEAGEDSDNASEDEGEGQPGAAVAGAAAGNGAAEAAGADVPEGIIADAADAAADAGADDNDGQAAAAGGDGAAADAAEEGP